MSNSRIGTSTRTFKLPVPTTPVQLVASNPKRTGLLVYNNGTATVYIISHQNMTKSDGIPIAASSSYENDTTTAKLYIIADSGTQDVRVQVDSE